jgi:TonB family protein
MRFGLLAVATLVLEAIVATGQEIPGPGATLPPRVVRSVKAVYTPEARVARIEGTVLVDAVVLSDGTVGDDVKVVQSLDTKFGLDDQAVKACKQWKFKPATKDGHPVIAHVTIEQVSDWIQSSPLPAIAL